MKVHVLKFFLFLFFSSLISLFAIAGMGGGMSRGKQFNLNLLAGVSQGQGNTDGVGNAVRFIGAHYMAINSLGHIYVADDGHAVRKIVVSGTTGTVTTFAGGNPSGGTNGNGVNARFGYLTGITIDSADNIYVGCAYYCDPIRKIATNADVTTFFTGSLGNPGGITISNSNFIYLSHNCAIYKITSAAVATLFSGVSGSCGGVDGVSTTARFQGQIKLYYHNPTNDLFVVDSENRAIRKIDVSGTATTFSGVIGLSGAVNGVSTTARFNYPQGMTYDASLGAFFVSDSKAIRRVSTSGTVSTLTGSLGVDNRRSADGTSATALINNPLGIVSNGSGLLYFMDEYQSLRRVDSSGNVVTIAGAFPDLYGTVDGTGSAAKFNISIEHITKDSSGNIYILESPLSHKIRKVTPRGVVTTHADVGCWAQDGKILFHSNGNIYFGCYQDRRIRQMNASGTVTLFSGAGTAGITDGASSTAQFQYINDLEEGPNGSIYVADVCAVRKVTTSGTVSTVVGIGNTCGRTKGAFASARFEQMSDMVVDSNGDIYAAERYTGVINKINIASATVAIHAGNYDQNGFANGTGTAARFDGITALTIAPSNNVYAFDQPNYAIRKVTPAGVVTTHAGRKPATWIPHITLGLQLGPLPASINYFSHIIYDRNKLFIVSPGGIFMAPAN